MEVLTSAELQNIIKRIAEEGTGFSNVQSKDLEMLAQELNNYRRELIFQNEELIRANEKLQMQEEEYRDFFTRAPVPYVIFNIRGQIIASNDAFASFIGVAAKSLIDREIGDFLMADSNNLFSFFLVSMEQNNRGYRQTMKLEFMLKGKLVETVAYFSFCMSGNQRLIRAMIVDVTEVNKAQRELEHERERYQIALEGSQDYIFEYDLSKDELMVYGSPLDKKISKNTPIYHRDFFKNVVSQKRWSPEKISQIEDFLSGDLDFLELEMFPSTDTLETKWVHIYGKTIVGNQRIVRIIGRIVDITESKRAKDRLLEQSYHDDLTGLYNPKYGLKLLKELMDCPGDSSIVLLDLHRFSQINESFSFTFGNILLIELSEIIGNILSSNDYAIRIGGDEFIIVFENASKRQIGSFIKKMQGKLKELHSDENEKKLLSLKALVIPRIPQEGYQAVENLLDYMLKKIRSLEVDEIVYLEDTTGLSLFIKPLTTKKAADFEGLSPMYCHNTTNLSELAFDLLEKTRNIKSAIRMLLSLIAKTYGFKRIGIYEKDPIYLSKQLLHQWPDDNNDEFEPVVHYPSSEVYYELLEFESKLEWIVIDYKLLSPLSMQTEEFLKRFSAAGIIVIPIFLEGRVSGIMEFYPQEIGTKWSTEDCKKIIELSKLISSHINRNKSDYANKAKSEFLSKMSHEIRTPLGGIVGLVDIMKKTLLSSDNADLANEEEPLRVKFINYLEKIEKSVQFLLSIINNSLEISKIESGKYQIENNVFCLSNLIENIETMFENQFKEKNIEFTIKADYSEDFLVGDMLRLNQILINLLGNALKFTPNDGKVTLGITESKNSDKVALLFEVRDNGIGIKEENVNRIFQSFEQVGAPNQNGTGLGLSICSSLIELMHSKLELETKYGAGSRFYFTLLLPIASKKEMRKLPANFNKEADKDVPLDFTGKRLLLVEDNELNAEIAQTLFEMKGFTVERADDGTVAVDKYTKASPYYYDIIIMDIRMPKMDGITATRLIRNMEKPDSRSIPIVAMTADAFSADVERSISCGMNGHLSKPIDSENMYRILAKLLF